MMNKFKKESFSNNSFQLNFRLIRVTEAGNGVVGQPCQFRVDASQAGEGQLEISINDGEVPNHVQVCQKSENIFFISIGRCACSATLDFILLKCKQKNNWLFRY